MKSKIGVVNNMQMTKPGPANGKLGILTAGSGAVFTTQFIGVEDIKNGGPIIGSKAWGGRIRLGKRGKKITTENSPFIKDFLPISLPDDLEFGTWDPIPDNGLEAALKAGVVDKETIQRYSEQLASIEPMPAVFENRFAERIKGDNVKVGRNKRDLAEKLMEDIARFKSERNCERLVVTFAGSTEILLQESAVHQSVEAFEKGLYDDNESISPSMIYAYAAIKSGVPFANGTPGLTCDIPAIVRLAKDNGVPICGKDFKTGETVMKTGIAPIILARQWKLDGWYSVNILGNRDGEVLDEEENLRSKQKTKSSVLSTILSEELYPELYGDYDHIVDIRYYLPRGDDKESWANIDIQGWLSKKMQIKINWIGRDSILAAPVKLDSELFLDLAHRAGMSGVVEQMGLFFKEPQTRCGKYPENNLFILQMMFTNWLRILGGKKPLTHAEIANYD